MTKTQLGAVVLLFGALASFGCGGDDMPTPDNGMSDPDVGTADEGVDDAGPNPDAGGLVDGVACTSPTQCDSGSCVDGVCCDVACTDTCMACTAKRFTVIDLAAGTREEHMGIMNALCGL